MKILIIEDEEDIKWSLAGFFEDYEHEVVVTDVMEVAIKEIEDSDVAIVDMRLPNLTGDKIIEQLYAINDSVIYFIHTGSTKYQLPPNLMDFGITEEDIFFKPVTDLTVFIDRIEKLTGT